MRIIRRFNSKLVQELASYAPRPLSAAEYMFFERTGSIEESFKFVRHELPIRLINIIEESRALPIPEIPPAIQNVKSNYENTLEKLLPFIDMPLNGESCALFDKELEKNLHQHRYVVEQMAVGIMEYKETLEDKEIAVAEDKIHYFLDRFFMNRFGAKLLCHQHLQHAAYKQNKQYRNRRRCFQLLNVTASVAEMVTKATNECTAYYKKAPNCKIVNYENGDEVSFVSTVYIPDHLENMVYEILKNAFRASVEYSMNKKSLIPPVEIIISKGDQNIAIKISDRGGGASLKQQQKWEAYLFSSGDAAPAENLNNPISVPMAGYGYGIPLTKVTARYLGGDIEIRSIEDYGTDVYIYLQTCPETCFEGISDRN